jgi:hypothetical protein
MIDTFLFIRLLNPMLKKVLFWSFFLLTLFEAMLKYTYVCQQANINRQQAIDIAENRTNRPAPIELSSRLIGAGPIIF